MPAPGGSIGPLTYESIKKDYNKDFHFSMMIHAAPKVGKTWCAATASKKFPKEYPLKQRVALDDILWISFDEDATIGLFAEGYDIPFEIDVVKLVQETKNIDNALATTKRIAIELLSANPQIKRVVS